MFSDPVTCVESPEGVAIKPSRLWPRCPIVMAWSGRAPVIGRYRSSRVRRSSSCGRWDFHPVAAHQDSRHASSSAAAWLKCPAEFRLNAASLEPLRERSASQAAWARSQPLSGDVSKLSAMTTPEDGLLPSCRKAAVRCCWSIEPSAPRAGPRLIAGAFRNPWLRTRCDLGHRIWPRTVPCRRGPISSHRCRSSR